MDGERIKGTVNEAGGSVKEMIGDALGDTKTKLSGKVDKVQGRAQEAFGAARDNVRDLTSTLVNEAGERLSDAASVASARAREYGEKAYKQSRMVGRSLAETIDERPLTAVLITGGVLFALGYLLRRR